MDVVDIVPFEGPDGVIRDLRVTPPPAGMVLLPAPDAPRSAFVAAGKATRTFAVRLLSFRLYVSVLRNTARMYADDGSLATAVGQGTSGALSMFASVRVSHHGATPGVGEEYVFEGMRFTLVSGHDLHGLQLHVIASCQYTPFDPTEIATAWLQTLEPVQRFDLVSEHQPPPLGAGGSGEPATPEPVSDSYRGRADGVRSPGAGGNSM